MNLWNLLLFFYKRKGWKRERERERERETVDDSQKPVLYQKMRFDTTILEITLESCKKPSNLSGSIAVETILPKTLVSNNQLRRIRWNWMENSPRRSSDSSKPGNFSLLFKIVVCAIIIFPLLPLFLLLPFLPLLAFPLAPYYFFLMLISKNKIHRMVLSTRCGSCSILGVW